MPLNFRLQKRQNIYEQILRIPTNWPPDILSAMYAYYLFVFSILYLYFMGDCNRNMKFGYFKASPKLKKIFSFSWNATELLPQLQVNFRLMSWWLPLQKGYWISSHIYVLLNCFLSSTTHHFCKDHAEHYWIGLARHTTHHDVPQTEFKITLHLVPSHCMAKEKK